MKEAKHVSKKSNSTNKSTNGQLKASSLGIQAKLQIGQPGDKYEREADAIADMVVQSATPNHSILPEGKGSTTIQRKCSSCEQEEKLQRKPLVSEISPLQIQQQRFPVYGRYKSQKDSFPEFCTHPNYMYNEETGCESPSIRYGWKPRSSKIIIDGKCKGGLKAKITEAEDFHEIGVCPDNEQIPIQAKEDGTLQGPSASFESTLSTSKSGGSLLPESTRNEMESKIGADFSQVRVHTNSSAIQMSQDIGAQAFTHGKDVYFNSGNYNPNTTNGKHLLAHELVHTVQQGRVVRMKGENRKADSVLDFFPRIRQGQKMKKFSEGESRTELSAAFSLLVGYGGESKIKLLLSEIFDENPLVANVFFNVFLGFLTHGISSTAYSTIKYLMKKARKKKIFRSKRINKLLKKGRKQLDSQQFDIIFGELKDEAKNKPNYEKSKRDTIVDQLFDQINASFMNFQRSVMKLPSLERNRIISKIFYLNNNPKYYRYFVELLISDYKDQISPIEQHSSYGSYWGVSGGSQIRPIRIVNEGKYLGMALVRMHFGIKTKYEFIVEISPTMEGLAYQKASQYNLSVPDVEYNNIQIDF